MATKTKAASKSAANAKTKLSVDTKKLVSAKLILRAVTHRLRMDLLKLIDRKPGTNVTNIYKTLDIEQSVASQHLAILRRAGIVNAERKGKEIFYSVNYDKLKTVDRAADVLLSE